jgi:ribosomal RNA-processing protein 17
MEILFLCREFLTGFHKRKLQRKKIAQEQLKQQLKEERKRLKEKVCTRVMRTHTDLPLIRINTIIFVITGSGVI